MSDPSREALAAAARWELAAWKAEPVTEYRASHDERLAALERVDWIKQAGKPVWGVA